MTKNGYYQFEVKPFEVGKLSDGWVYEIYDLESPPNLIRESQEWFDSEAQASFAAVGHISLLENGEG